jgi:hypothetical protein
MSNTGQRRHKRYEVHDVKGGLLFRTQVVVRNISVSGLSFETTERLKLGRNYSLRLSNAHDCVDLKGTIRWCHLARTSANGGESVPVYEAGLAFDDVLSERAQNVLRFIEENVVVSIEKRITGRFTPDEIGPAEIEARYDFEVLKISLSGMLVRTQLEAAVGSRFGMEVVLRDSAVPVSGRVASVHRANGGLVEPASELGIEFLDLHEETRLALTSFISNELEEPRASAIPS